MIERQIKLIQLFLNNEHQYITSSDVASFLNVSNRTIRSDIKVINSIFLNDLIISVKSRGYQLNKEVYPIEYIEETLKSHTDKDHKVLVSLGYKLLMSDEPLTLVDLENMYDLSKKEIIDYLSRINAWCEKYDVHIKLKRRKGVEVEGSETDLNNAVLHLNQLAPKNDRVEALILSELPKAHVNMMKQIIEQQLTSFDLNTSDVQVEQLLIHLILILKRKQHETPLGDINKEAFKIAQQIIQEIRDKLGYSLNRHTVELFSLFISYHFNKFDLGVQKLFIESYINRMIERMEERIGVFFTQDKVLRENLYTHFSRTYLRIMKEVNLNNPLIKEIKTLYPFIFNILYEIVRSMSNDSGIDLSEDEIGYLTIHFQSSIDRNEQEKLRIVIACYYGIGISQLLAAKVAQLSRKIEVANTIKLEDIQSYDFSNVDVLMTTHDIELPNINKSVETLQVSPLLSDTDKHVIERMISKKLKPSMKTKEMDEINFIVETEGSQSFTMPIIFDKSQTILNQNHAITEGYIESALEREKTSSTYIGKGIAIPHGNPKKVLKSQVIIYRSYKGFYWKEHPVKIIFFLGMAQKDIKITKRIIQTIAQLDEADIDQLMLLDDQAFKTKLLQIFKR